MSAIPNSSGQTMTGIIFDNLTNKTYPSYDVIDIDIIESLTKSRLDICDLCENLIVIDNKRRCKLCACGMDDRTKLIFPLDENGKAFAHISPTNEYLYVCKMKKW